MCSFVKYRVAVASIRLLPLIRREIARLDSRPVRALITREISYQDRKDRQMIALVYSVVEIKLPF